MGIDQASLRHHDKQRQRQRHTGNGAGQQQTNKNCRLTAKPIACESIAARHPDQNGNNGAGHRNNKRIGEILHHRHPTFARTAEHGPVVIKVQTARHPNWWLGHNIHRRAERIEHDPKARDTDDRHRNKQSDVAQRCTNAGFKTVLSIDIHRHHPPIPSSARAALSFLKKKMVKNIAIKIET